MSNHSWLRGLTWGLWLILLVDIPIAISMRVEFNAWWKVRLFLWLLPSLFLVSTLLPWLYYQQVGQWWCWSAQLGIFLVGTTLMTQPSISMGVFGTLLMMILFFGGWALFMNLIIHLIKRDIAAPMYACLALLDTWNGVFVIGAQDDLFAAVGRFIVTGQPLLLWFVLLLSASMLIITPVCLLAYLGHSVVILFRELFEASPRS